MSELAPTDVGALAALRVLLCLAVAGLVVFAVARPLLRHYAPRQRLVLLWALAAVSLATLSVGWLGIGVPTLSQHQADAASYQTDIAAIARFLQPGVSAPRPDLGSHIDRGVFLALMGGAQAVFGISGYVTVVVAALLAALSLLVLVELTRLLVPSPPPAGHPSVGLRAAVVAGVLVAVLPAVPLWFGQPLREGLVALLVLSSLLLSVQVAQQGRPTAILGNLGVLLALQFTRSDPVPLLLAALGIAILLAVVRRRRQSPDRRPVTGACAPAALIASGGLLVAAVGLGIGPATNRYIWWFAERSRWQFAVLQEASSTAAADLAGSGLHLSGGADLLARSPAALARALWGPPPTMAATPSGPLLIDAAALWLLTPLVAMGVLLAWRHRRWVAVLPLGFGLAWLTISGLILGSYGILSRLRLSGWLALLPFAAWGGVVLADRWRSRREASAPAALPSGRSTRPSPD